MHISKNQLSLLQRIAKNYLVRTDPAAIDDIEYLRANGLVLVTKCEKSGDYYYHPTITEKGKAFLYERKYANRRANIALVISVIALAISLLTAFTPFADWCKAWINSSFPVILG